MRPQRHVRDNAITAASRVASTGDPSTQIASQEMRNTKIPQQVRHEFSRIRLVWPQWLTSVGKVEWFVLAGTECAIRHSPYFAPNVLLNQCVSLFTGKASLRLSVSLNQGNDLNVDIYSLVAPTVKRHKDDDGVTQKSTFKRTLVDAVTTHRPEARPSLPRLSSNNTVGR